MPKLPSPAESRPGELDPTEKSLLDPISLDHDVDRFYHAKDIADTVDLTFAGVDAPESPSPDDKTSGQE